jgi:hypothetical protein
MNDLTELFLVDASGKRTHVVLALKTYEALLAQVAQKSGMQVGEVPAQQGLQAIFQDASSVTDATASASEEVFTFVLPSKGGQARGLWRFPTMVVLKGSIIAGSVAQAMPDDYRRLRQKLIDI